MPPIRPTADNTARMPPDGMNSSATISKNPAAIRAMARVRFGSILFPVVSGQWSAVQLRILSRSCTPHTMRSVQLVTDNGPLTTLRELHRLDNDTVAFDLDHLHPGARDDVTSLG